MSKSFKKLHLMFWGATVTALGGALGAWFLGVLPAIWSAIVSAAAWVWALAWSTIPLPVVALLVLVLLALRGIAAMWPHAAAPAAELELDLQLSDLEQRMLGVLVEADGDMVYVDAAAQLLGVSRLRLQQACEDLVARGFIQANHRATQGSRVYLTSAGRDHVLQKGYH